MMKKHAFQRKKEEAFVKTHCRNSSRAYIPSGVGKIFSLDSGEPQKKEEEQHKHHKFLTSLVFCRHMQVML